MGRLDKADIIIARFLLMCLFMPAHLQVFVAIGAAVYFTYRTVKVREFPSRSTLLWALLLGGGYLMYVGAIPLTPPGWRHEVGRLCERRAAFPLMPFLFAVMAPRFRAVLVGQLVYFMYGCLITCLVVNAAFAWHHFYAHDLPAGPAHVIYRVVIERFTGIHPTYLSVYLCFSVCIAMFHLPSESTRQAIVKVGLVGLMLSFMLAMFAKAPIIALGIIAIFYAVAARRNLYRFRWGIAALGGVVVAASMLVPFVRQRAGEMFGLFHQGAGQLTDNSVNVRKLLFNTDVSMLKRYWLTGVGPGRLLNALHHRYFFHSLYSGYWVGYFDPHSQYFYEWLSFGIAGITYLLIILWVQFARAARTRNLLYTFLLILVAVTFFTESLLARQQGLLFYSIFTSLFFFSDLKSRQEIR